VGHTLRLQARGLPALDLLGFQLHGHDIRTGTSLRHGQGTNELASNEAGQVFRLLSGGPIAMDLVDTEVGVGSIAESDTARGSAYLLHDVRVVQVAQPKASILGCNSDAQHTCT
jgi:hypothetical protein